ncbi:pyrimidine-nucleoside phosphorylase [Gorillibacterium sp. sgz5001074]|uniref:pyrimidine-nucleoside phosphorylase n=1 Tax=Gorillibacterium sp. sgz5001074 TaxID=3446695 RepID=UPI003F680A91
MRTVDMIQKKRDGGELTRQEISALIQGYTQGTIPDYQMSAWAMAVYFQGMTARETADLTLEMAASGEQMDLSSIRGVKVDKHSTGGVGDTVTLVLAPLTAAAGVPVAKMSGRGLGHTGGTIDKLEAIPGFTVELTRDAFIRQVNEHGVAVISQSGNVTPADKKLYGLRDVTATVNSIPLIASSIMSKKIASGADAIVLDVKTGSGAFMKTLEDSVRLAEAMVSIGTEVGRRTVAVITDMEEPLGTAVGNALEVRLAVETLQGRGPKDLEELCLELGSHMLVLGGAADTASTAKEKLKEAIASGAALRKFKEFVAAQGGDPAVGDNPELLPTASRQREVPAAADGYVGHITAEEIGVAAMELGAGRETKESVIDLSVGIRLLKKVGDPVRRGEPLAVLYAKSTEDNAKLDSIQERVRLAYRIQSEAAEPRKLIHAVITKDGVTYR